MFDDQPHQRVTGQPGGGGGGDDPEPVQQRLPGGPQVEQGLQLHAHTRVRPVARLPLGGQVGAGHAAAQQLLQRVGHPLGVGARFHPGPAFTEDPVIRHTTGSTGAAGRVLGGLAGGLLFGGLLLGFAFGLAGGLGHHRQGGLELVGHRRVQHRVQPRQVTHAHDPHRPQTQGLGLGLVAVGVVQVGQHLAELGDSLRPGPGGQHHQLPVPST